MDIYLFIASSGSLCCIALGIFVFLKDRKKTLNLLFFLMSISFGTLIFAGNLVFTADNIEQVHFRFMISTFSYAAVFALNLHFFIIFTKQKLKACQTAIIYIPALIIIINILRGKSIFSHYMRTGDTWNCIPAYNSFDLYFTIIYITLYMLISIILVERYRRRTVLNKEKRQAIIINYAYFLTMTFAITSIVVFPKFDIYCFSRISPNAYLIYCIAIFYSVFKLKFLSLSPAIMVNEIIERIGEMIFLLGTDFKIVMGNSRSLEILKTSPEELKKKSYQDIIANTENINSEINEYPENQEKDLYKSISYICNGENILTDTYISRIYDNFRDLAGFLVISRINNGKIMLKKAYNLSDREFDVIELILAGLSNKETAERLGITKRTVETHCLHIYLKLNIKDRIELFKFANEFNLLPKK